MLESSEMSRFLLQKSLSLMKRSWRTALGASPV